MKFSMFVMDAALEENGVWHDVGDGLRLKIARMGNPNYRRALASASKPHREALRGPGADDVLQRVLINAIVESILIGWEGLEDDHGNAIPYNRETAVDCLTKSRDFRDLVVEIAERKELFRRTEADAAGKS